MNHTPTPLMELARFFLRLGFTAFGGPAAHLAIMRDEVVTRRGWLTETEFLDLISAANLIPGPSSTEVAIHIGYRRCGWAGLAVAGLCFILPAALIVAAIAAAYSRYGSILASSGLLRGVKPAVIAVVLQAIVGLARPAIKTRALLLLAVAAGAFAFMGFAVLPLLIGAGVLAAASGWARARRTQGTSLSPQPLIAIIAGSAALILLPSLLTWFFPAPHGRIAFGLLPLFLFFLKIGSVVYGSGYVLLAFLRDGLVTGWHWLSEGQLIDAIAVGQITPGPVFTTATFIGYLLGGVAGALAATVAIFLPSFVFVAATAPVAARMRNLPLASSFLDGVNAGAIALMVVVTVQLARAALVDVPTASIALVSAFLLVRVRVPSMYVIAGSALAGIVIAHVR
ncbi:MAG: chromate efflux transporter [Capsulimonadaceae bacterium]|nr:chromate efflux transporter [Capsulimonadaceae bacterium]